MRRSYFNRKEAGMAEIQFPVGLVYIKFILHENTEEEIDEIVEHFGLDGALIIHTKDKKERRKVARTQPLPIYSPIVDGFLYVVVSPEYEKNILRKLSRGAPIGFIYELESGKYYTVYPEFYVGKTFEDNWKLALFLKRRKVKGVLYNPDMRKEGYRISGTGLFIEKKNFLESITAQIKEQALLN